MTLSELPWLHPDDLFYATDDELEWLWARRDLIPGRIRRTLADYLGREDKVVASVASRGDGHTQTTKDSYPHPLEVNL